jgi:hypothetical protein
MVTIKGINVNVVAPTEMEWQEYMTIAHFFVSVPKEVHDKVASKFPNRTFGFEAKLTLKESIREEGKLYIEYYDGVNTLQYAPGGFNPYGKWIRENIGAELLAYGYTITEEVA